MKYRAGFLKVACAWMVTLMQGLDAGHVPRKHAVAVSCSPKDQAVLTKSEVEESLAAFDEANGKHLGTWSPGFPEIQVHEDSLPSGSKVQCSLLFMAQGLEKILEDQKNNLNPQDVSLHKKLRETISRVKLLAGCMKSIRGGECSPKPSPPKMPQHVFAKKQWGHTLLKTARDYLDWLQSKIVVNISKVKVTNKIKRKVTKATPQKYFEGSGYLL